MGLLIVATDGKNLASSKKSFSGLLTEKGSTLFHASIDDTIFDLI